MRQGSAKNITRHKNPIDLTVDHIIDLLIGGDNNFENLMITPYHVNYIKNRLLEIQMHFFGGMRTFVSFKPSNGAVVPLVKGGFRILLKGETLQARTLDFFTPHR